MCCCAIPAPRAPPFAPPLAPPLPCARRNLAGSFPLVLKQVNGDGKIDIAATTTTGFGALYILFLDSVHNLLSFMKLVPTDGMVGGCAGPFPLFALSRAHVKRFPATPPPCVRFTALFPANECFRPGQSGACIRRIRAAHRGLGW